MANKNTVKNKAKQLKIKQLKAEGKLVGMYLYLANADMSVTKDEVATRPIAIVRQDPELGYLLLPMSHKNLDEVPHIPVLLPGAKEGSYLAPNQHYWVKEVPTNLCKVLPANIWEMIQVNLNLITAACKVDPKINASLNDWLKAATIKTTKEVTK